MIKFKKLTHILLFCLIITPIVHADNTNISPQDEGLIIGLSIVGTVILVAIGVAIGSEIYKYLTLASMGETLEAQVDATNSDQQKENLRTFANEMRLAAEESNTDMEFMNKLKSSVLGSVFGEEARMAAGPLLDSIRSILQSVAGKFTLGRSGVVGAGVRERMIFQFTRLVLNRLRDDPSFQQALKDLSEFPDAEKMRQLIEQNLNDDVKNFTFQALAREKLALLIQEAAPDVDSHAILQFVQSQQADNESGLIQEQYKNLYDKLSTLTDDQLKQAIQDIKLSDLNKENMVRKVKEIYNQRMDEIKSMLKGAGFENIETTFGGLKNTATELFRLGKNIDGAKQIIASEGRLLLRVTDEGKAKDYELKDNKLVETDNKIKDSIELPKDLYAGVDV